MSHFSTLQSLLVLIIHVYSLSDGSVWPSTPFLVLLWSSICMYVCVYVVVVSQSTCSLHIYCYIILIYKWLAHLIGIILSRRQINCSRMFSLYYIYTYIFILYIKVVDSMSTVLIAEFHVIKCKQVLIKKLEANKY